MYVPSSQLIRVHPSQPCRGSLWWLPRSNEALISPPQPKGQQVEGAEVTSRKEGPQQRHSSIDRKKSEVLSRSFMLHQSQEMTSTCPEIDGSILGISIVWDEDEVTSQLSTARLYRTAMQLWASNTDLHTARRPRL